MAWIFPTIACRNLLFNDLLTDLHNILFEELERLSDPEVAGDELKAEVERAKAMTIISSQLIANGNLVLKAAEFKAEYGAPSIALPEFLDD